MKHIVKLDVIFSFLYNELYMDKEHGIYAKFYNRQGYGIGDGGGEYNGVGFGSYTACGQGTEWGTGFCSGATGC